MHLFFSSLVGSSPHGSPNQQWNGPEEACSRRKESKGDGLDRGHQGAGAWTADWVFVLVQRSCVALGESCTSLYLSPWQSRGNLLPVLVSIMPAGWANADENAWSIVKTYPQVRRGFLTIAGEQREEGSQLAPTVNFYKPEPEDLVLGPLLPLSPGEWTEHGAVSENGSGRMAIFPVTVPHMHEASL